MSATQIALDVKGTGVEAPVPKRKRSAFTENGMAQEVEAQALAQGCPLDQAGHIGDGEDHIARQHHAQVGHQGGERVVGHLGPCSRNGGDQR